LVYKLHIILGLTLFVITPFTRLVHIWSAPIWYLFRPGYQIVRSLGPVRRRTTEPPALSGYGGQTVARQHSESGESGA
jgi:nitrate reductase gamma subunit